MTATVTAQNGSTPSGTVIFQSNGTQIGSASLDNSGVAVLNYSGLSVGTDNITAIYQGSVTLAGSTSNTVMQVVHPGTTTTVTSTPNPSTVGQQVTITATVGPAGPPQPTGSVSFTSNGTAISGCTNVTLSNLTAQCVSSSLPTGTDMVVATYSGDSNYGPSQGLVVQIVNPIATAIKFVTLPPCRVVDTRNPNGNFGGPAIQGGTSRSFPLAEGDNPCGIPSDAVAYSLNVTVVTNGHLGYLTIWPTGEGQPTVSTMNSPDGRTKANAAIVPAGTPNGSVSLYVSDTTNVILDINDYFATSGSSTLEFYPLSPCRVVDTRGPDGNLGGPYLQGHQERDFPVLESNCNLPNAAAAYSMNFTALPKGSRLGYLTVWPVGQSQPQVSTLNDPTGTNVANAAIVPAGTSGAIATYVTDDTDLLVDVDGYFAPAGSGGLSFYALTPCRVLDTRSGGGQPFTGELTVQVQNSPCGPPSTAQGYVFNATAIPHGALYYLTLWPDTEQQPTVSTLNAKDGAITSNMAIVPNVNGKTDAWAQGYTQLILDISGYFAP
jgi:Bacterial Ig-like domain (group 3)